MKGRQYSKLEKSYDSEAHDSLIENPGDLIHTTEGTTALHSPTLIFPPGFFKREGKTAVGEDSKCKEPVENPNEETRGQRYVNDMGFDDGKTKECNRNHTFETFVHHSRLGQDEPAKLVGHGWEVWRALKRVKQVKRGRRAFTKRSIDRSTLSVDYLS